MDLRQPNLERRERREEEEDWISSMPDDILICILSRLTAEEAVRTSILSRRWRRLWLYISNLDFDSSKKMKSLEMRALYTHGAERKKMRYAIDAEIISYISWVNRVTRSSRAMKLDLFRIFFYLDHRHLDEINSWVEFAADKGVRELEINCDARIVFQQHVFPLVQPSFFSRFKFLTSLCLGQVNISGEQLGHFLSECKLLERVCISHSQTLTHLRVAEGPPLRLNHLEISQCNMQESLMIFAPTPNLVSFSFHSTARSLHINSAPQLVQLSVSNHLPTFSRFFSQLQTLAIKCKDWDQVVSVLQGFPESTCLKHLTICHGVSVSNTPTLAELTSLIIRTSPFLHHLTIQLQSSCYWKIGDSPTGDCHSRYLRVVELVGFRGSRDDIKLASYLINSAFISARKLVIDLRDPYFLGSFLEINVRATKKSEESRGEALRRIEQRLRTGVEMVVIRGDCNPHYP